METLPFRLENGTFPIMNKLKETPYLVNNLARKRKTDLNARKRSATRDHRARTRPSNLAGSACMT